MLDWMIAHPAETVALATVALAVLALAAFGLVILVGVFLILWFGIRALTRSPAPRSEGGDTEREEMQRRREADKRRHDEVIAVLTRQADAAERRHQEAMLAFKATVEPRSEPPRPKG